MEIIIKGTPKEIADLALELQGRQNEEVVFSGGEVEFNIIAIVDSVSSEIPPTRKIKTFGDLKKAFKKMTDSFTDPKLEEKRFEDAKKSFTKLLDDEEETWKKDFLTRDFKYSDTPINHDPPKGYVKITELDLAVSDYIADQRLRKDKSVLADPFVPDQLLSEFIKAYWSKHCDLNLGKEMKKC